MLPDWKPIPGFPNYEVSYLGEVRNVKTKRILSPYDNCGYLSLNLSKEGKATKVYVHRLVLMAYSPREDFEYLDVHHKNGRRRDNRLENLEWTTRQVNCQERSDSRAPITEQVNRLINKYGYELTYKLLSEIP